MIFAIFFSFPFDIDYAQFKVSAELYLAEIYYSCLPSIFEPIPESDEIEYKIFYEIEDPIQKRILKDTLHRKVKLPKEVPQEYRFSDFFGFYATPGTYFVKMKAFIGEDTFKKEFPIQIKDLNTSPALSSIVLCRNILPDSLNKGVPKGNIRILPNEERTFLTKINPIMGIYYEVYNLIPDSEKYKLFIKILDEDSSVIHEFSQEKSKLASDLQDAIALNIQGLREGKYTLIIEVKDPSQPQSASAYKDFFIKKETHREYRVEFLPQDLEYAKLFFLWATPEEVKKYETLTQEGKLSFLRRFWSKHDLQEFIKRVKFCEKRFREGKKAGYQTDRGKVYIKYGPPDEIKTKSFGETYRGYEHWHYYKSNYHFVFADKQDTGIFTLIFSNAKPKYVDPNWRVYVDEEDERLLEGLLE